MNLKALAPFLEATAPDITAVELAEFAKAVPKDDPVTAVDAPNNPPAEVVDANPVPLELPNEVSPVVAVGAPEPNENPLVCAVDGAAG